MRKAIALAERGRPTTSPNPLVGALVVDAEGVIVGRGAHRVAGGPHAEVLALEDAGPRARGATLYCTLEPCTHTGRTGPCAPLVAGAGIRRVVIAMTDPNPLVHGAGLDYLRHHGVDVLTGVEEAAAARQNAAFLTWILKRRPFVILKAALSIDGRLAAAPGAPTRLTGAAANRRVQRQRAEVDAIGIGSGTLLTDDPLLTPRGAYRVRPLTRVVFDRRLRTRPTARVFSTLESGPVIIMTTEQSAREAPDRMRALSAAGAEVLWSSASDLSPALAMLFEQKAITSIVLEGGTALHAAALEAQIVDLIQLYIAPVVLGPHAVDWVGGGRLAWEFLGERSASWFGDDVRVQGYVHGDH